jgi:hypothetical protein
MPFLVSNINQVLPRTGRCTILHFNIRKLDTIYEFTS